MSHEVWAIREKATGKFWMSDAGKIAWSKPGSAKSAWTRNYKKYRQPKHGKFDDQTEYELVNLSQFADHDKILSTACKLLSASVNEVSDPTLRSDIEDFLKKMSKS